MEQQDKQLEDLKHLQTLLVMYLFVFIAEAIGFYFFHDNHTIAISITLALLVIAVSVTLYMINKRKKQITLNKAIDAQREKELGELQKLKKWEFLSNLNTQEQQAVTNQFQIAKVWGFWTLPELDDEIIKHFLKSDKVKIKVTRGYNLFINDGKESKRDVFYHCIFEEGRNQKRDIELLLHYPCSKSEHTIQRAAANRISVDRYIETLFEVIRKVKETTQATDNKNEISVKFYSDYEIKWRYYIFQEKPDHKKILFLNYYDEKSPAADSSMIKIEYGEGTLCKDFDAKFDSIFNDKSQTIEIVSNNKGDNSLHNADWCNHPECKKLIEEKYKKVFKK